MKTNTFRVRVQRVDSNVSVSPDGGFFKNDNKAMIIVDLERSNGGSIYCASEAFDITSKESRRSAVASAIGDLAALLISQCFPEDTPNYKLTYEEGKGLKHEFHGMAEELTHA